MHPGDSGSYNISIGDSNIAASTELIGRRGTFKEFAHFSASRKPNKFSSLKIIVMDDLVYPQRIAPGTCPENEQGCKSGHCIPKGLWCDGVTDCPDGDDERINCGNWGENFCFTCCILLCEIVTSVCVNPGNRVPSSVLVKNSVPGNLYRNWALRSYWGGNLSR